MATTLLYTKMLTPAELSDPGVMLISDEGRIEYIGLAEKAPQQASERLDLRGWIVVPGFIDIHVHGGNGVTFGETGDAAAELRAYSDWVASSGVTGFLCSLAAADSQALVELVANYVEAMQAGLPGAEPLGIHLEGPFINREKKGAFNPAWLRMPSVAETEAVLAAGKGWIRQVTLAPELPGASQVAARFREAGVVVSMGHTNTDYESASAALQGDFTHVTHTFNAQSGFHHRQPGVFGAILASDRITAEVIADTIHAHPGAIKVLVRCLGPDRVVAITDAMSGAGLQDGTYNLVGQTVYVKGGMATLSDGTIAGSTARMNQCVRNLVQRVGASLSEAVQMASLNPARAMGLADRLGSLEVGKTASLVAIDENINVNLAMVRGKVVYRS